MRLFFVILISLFSFVFVLAQDTDMVVVDAKLDWSKLNEATDQLGNIDVWFCEMPEEKTMKYSLVAWEKKKICLLITNNLDTEVNLHIWFVDSVITADEYKTRACQTEDKVNDIQNYISWYESDIVVPAISEIKKYAILEYPEVWNYSWCLVYSLPGKENWWTVNFTVVMRKAKFMDISVVKSVWWLDKRFLIAMFIWAFVISFLNKFRKFRKLKKPRN